MLERLNSYRQGVYLVDFCLDLFIKTRVGQDMSRVGLRESFNVHPVVCHFFDEFIEGFQGVLMHSESGKRLICLGRLVFKEVFVLGYHKFLEVNPCFNIGSIPSPNLEGFNKYLCL